ncbi:hypothetical protein ONE63_004534 [Megalurothrips usitatus]|uniref:Reverse transcriptase domain-containing protein n=1 Tax=Megalurothrips usitatus TaxID=439358 RepID=A0AAV7X737_9NEOP|nr:hypothetical protein ONE63_004534 [Megalurothrips usitatus]
MNLKIISVNLCAATSAAKIEALTDTIRSHSAEIVSLQEVAAQTLDIGGYEELVNAGPNLQGTAILVRDTLHATPLHSLPSGRACAQACHARPRTREAATHIKAIKRELLECHAELAAGALDRAKMRDELRDEALSTAHVVRAARRARGQRIKSIQDADGNTLADEGDVREYFRTVYAAKFQEPEGGGTADSPILDAVEATVTDEDNARLSRPFTVDEVLAAVKKSPKKKSPGPDGITAEFYAAAWSVIGDVLTEVFNDMWERRMVPAEMTKGVITLIPKKAKPRVDKDFRPITLLDVDVKILARLMAARLGVLQRKLLHDNQVRPGGKRTMAGALCDLRDVISVMGALRTPGCILSIDFSGAFDAVHHKYLFQVLRKQGVAEQFVNTIEAMYTGAASQLRVNGVLTSPFRVDRSVRQGCPLSMLLYAIIAAPFLIVLDRRLRGLQLAGCTIRVSAFADDSFIVLRSHSEAAVVKEVLQQFAEVSGLAANPAKCGAPAAGSWDASERTGFPYVETLKVLGVTFARDIKTTIRLNWDAVATGVQGVLRESVCRAFGLSQRAEYARTYALAKLWHAAQVLPAPKAAADRVRKAVAVFVWRGQIFRTSMAVACTERARGGLGVPDIHIKCLALYTGRWQGILVDTEDTSAAKWLLTVLLAFPLGQRLTRLWATAAHYAAFHRVRKTAANSPVDVPARQAIRAIYGEMRAAAPAQTPRVARKPPEVRWEQVWAYINRPAIPQAARDSWWTAVHDLVPTRQRLRRIGRADTAACLKCQAEDTLEHRLTACDEAAGAWEWLRAVLGRELGRDAHIGDILRPEYQIGDEGGRLAAVWATAHAVHAALLGQPEDARRNAIQRAKEQHPEIVERLSESMWRQ